eukprot:TRINITY_DN1898_c0_g2_i3.p1 TRINITY_DN1898_c0_g2~~TRINITY_DN1898_c0_g2_i3.p1  ORF type:complete len:147 (-),score=11.02 TRINITY_DN1898_c0_g2_i3:819-1259(-)
MLSNQIIYRCQVSFAGFLLSSPFVCYYTYKTEVIELRHLPLMRILKTGILSNTLVSMMGIGLGLGVSYGLYTALSYPTPCTEEGLSSNGAISCGLGSIATILYTHTLKFSWQRSLHSVLRFSPVSFLIGGTIFPYLYYHTYMRSSD